MKLIWTFSLAVISLTCLNAFRAKKAETPSPLAVYGSAWAHPGYSKANTAENANYMSTKEKQVIYILNLVRSNPQLFAQTVLKKYPQTARNPRIVNTAYYRSLMTELLSMKPMGLLQPDKQSFTSAQSHAYASGISGYVGHERKGNALEKKHYNGECCYYGKNDPLDIVVSLLIDEGVPSLGHRRIMFSNYAKVGVSIQPHVKYGYNTVLDFHY